MSLNASPASVRLHPNAISFPVSLSTIVLPGEYDAVTGIKSSASLSTSILRFVRACQNAGSTSEENGWNCMMVIRVVANNAGGVGKGKRAAKGSSSRMPKSLSKVPQPRNP